MTIFSLAWQSQQRVRFECRSLQSGAERQHRRTGQQAKVARTSDPRRELVPEESALREGEGGEPTAL